MVGTPPGRRTALGTDAAAIRRNARAGPTGAPRYAGDRRTTDNRTSEPGPELTPSWSGGADGQAGWRVACGRPLGRFTASCCTRRGRGAMGSVTIPQPGTGHRGTIRAPAIGKWPARPSDGPACAPRGASGARHGRVRRETSGGVKRRPPEPVRPATAAGARGETPHRAGRKTPHRVRRKTPHRARREIDEQSRRLQAVRRWGAGSSPPRPATLDRRRPAPTPPR
jgi:hypothetical protein